MVERLTDTVNVMVPVGALGAGIKREYVEAGIAAGAQAIACDAGSTDSGPAYLGTARSKYSRDAVKADLTLLMVAQSREKIPLLIGSCGTSGADAALDWTRDIALEIAREQGLTPRIALLYCEQPAAMLEAALAEGRIAPLPPMPIPEPGVFMACDRIVAVMGSEPYIAALEAGADIVLGGRTSDTAVIAAVPVMRGAGRAASWHAGKIAECGGQATVNPRDGGVLIRVGRDAFEIEPLSLANACTPQTVAAHLLYENSNPFRLIEPGGILDVTNARYAAVDDRRVMVAGARTESKPYTMKLEGVAAVGFQTMMLVGIQDPEVLANIDRFVVQMHAGMTGRIREAMKLADTAYSLSLRPYGWNAVSGITPAAGTPTPNEVGLLFVATASTQALATQIAKTCNPYFFHMPLNLNAELPSYAFPFSPAETERGAVYEFRLNHVIAVDDPLALVRMEFADVGASHDA